MSATGTVRQRVRAVSAVAAGEDPRAASDNAAAGERHGEGRKARWRRMLAGGGAVLAGFAAPAAGVERAVVLSSDFVSAYHSCMNTDSPWSRTVNIAPACADAVVRAHGDRVYLLGRFGCDHVQVIDGTNCQAGVQWSTGPGTNPHDIEIVTPTKAYVTLYDTNRIGIFNPQTGANLGQISLAAFSDADGFPEADEMARVGDRVFVAVERLDRNNNYSASNPSFLAVVDVTNDQLIDVDPQAQGVQGILLTGRNPFGELNVDPVRRQIIVPEAGNFGALDGGAEFVDPVTLTAGGFFITEAELGGDLNAVRLWTDCTGYAIVNDASFNTHLARFDWCTGTKLQDCLTTAGFNLSDVEIAPNADVFVTDRDLNVPGVRVFQAPGCSQLTVAPLGFGLPPYDIALVGDLLPTTTPPPAAAALRLLPNVPNPFNPATTLRFAAPTGTPVVLEVLDVRGRRLAVLWDGMAPRETGEVIWRGVDGSGRALPSGVYVARLRGAGMQQSVHVTLVR
jgi:hypothetical protein